MLSKMKCTGSSFVFCQRDIPGPDKNAAEWLVHQEYQARTIERCLQGCREGTHLLRSFLSVKNVEDHPAPPHDNETWPLEDCVAHVTYVSPPGVEHQVSVTRICLKILLDFSLCLSSYFTFSRTKSANRAAKAFQSDNSSVRGWQRVSFLHCNSVKPTCEPRYNWKFSFFSTTKKINFLT